jgi:hypothetical protein
MNITQLEKEIIRVLKINENVDWDFSDIPPKEEFKELQIFIKRLFKEYRGQLMTQRDEGHNYRDSKNKAREYERKQKYEAIIDMVIRWLDSNIDEWEDDKTKYILNSEDQKQMIEKNAIAQDSADLKEKIELALDPSTTKRQIENGDL